MDKPFPAYQGDEPYVFVCYAHEDEAFVYPEIEWLHGQGINIWYDEGISAGKVWRAEIAEAIQGASKFLYYVSRAALASDHCNREIDYALDRAFDVVPVFLEETQLTPELDLALNRVQALHRGRDTRYQEHLLDAVGGTTAVEPQAVATKKKQTIPLFAGLAVLVTVIAALSWFGLNSFDTSSSRGSPIDSVAVLPLDEIGVSSDSQWLTHGIASDLTEMLASVPTIRVASLTNAFVFEDSSRSLSTIGEELGVEGLLVGTLEVSDRSVEVKMELVRSSDAEVIWRANFRGATDNPQALQGRLAGQIFKYFGEQFSDYGLSRPKTAEAYKANMKRLAQTLTGNIEAELKWAEMTTSLEPDYAMGYVNTVFPYLYAAETDPGGPWKAKVRHALDEAARLGISQSSAYKTHEGLYQWVFEGDLERAEPLLREAFIAPDVYGRIYYARLLAASGIHEPVLRLFERLTVTEPYAVLHWELLANQRAFLQDFDGAVGALNKALELAGPNNFFIIRKRASAHLRAGHIDLAREDLGRLRALSIDPFRWDTLEVALKQDLDSRVSFAQTLSSKGRHREAALQYLTADDARAQGAFVSTLASPEWKKYWTDSYEWVIPARFRDTSIWRSYVEGLGYTDAWRLEICRRASTLPPETGLGCDPKKYELD